MPPRKEEPKKDHFVEWGFVLLVIGILILLWSYILRSFYVVSLWNAIVYWFLHFIWPILVVLSIILAVLAILGTIYNIRRLNAILEEEKKIYGPLPDEEPLPAEPVVEKNDKWERVMAHANSANASDWRQAIIEADVMLGEILRTEGYHGDSVGEMLRGVDRIELLSLDAAWEAHKVRNEIAHAGGDYELNERNTRRVILLYESVFKELKVI
ncbi:hypothetical protein KW800_01805 [Candidatus Parcubacteria bacterium]|nr:hypothetical protein [Candidatus Parcubacteria bacterium]